MLSSYCIPDPLPEGETTLKQFCTVPKNPSDYSAPRPACTEPATGVQLVRRPPGGDIEQTTECRRPLQAPPLSRHVTRVANPCTRRFRWSRSTVSRVLGRERRQQGAPRGRRPAVRASCPASFGFCGAWTLGGLLPGCESS